MSPVYLRILSLLTFETAVEGWSDFILTYCCPKPKVSQGYLGIFMALAGISICLKICVTSTHSVTMTSSNNTPSYCVNQASTKKAMDDIETLTLNISLALSSLCWGCNVGQWFSPLICIYILPLSFTLSSVYTGTDRLRLSLYLLVTPVGGMREFFP